MNVPDEVTIKLLQDSKTLEQCLKKISDFGQTTYINICTGQSATVPWGSVDWGETILVAGACLSFIACVGALVITTRRD